MRHQHGGRGPIEHLSETEERLTEALARLIFAGVAPEERRQRIAGRRGTVHREVGDERLRLARRQRQCLARARTSVDGTERDVSVTAFPLFAHADEFVGVMTIFWREQATG